MNGHNEEFAGVAKAEQIRVDTTSGAVSQTYDVLQVNTLNVAATEVASAIKKSHSLRMSDLVLVAPGSIPITTSGKIRRSACVDRYRQDEFSRLDVTA